MTSSLTSATTPEAIGHYLLLEAIGRGGMGLVFRARDTRLERDVAIKCLRTELFEAHYIERFKREALLLAKLNHPNIVQIYDFIDAPEQLALVMELVDGQNLQNYLREHIVPLRQRVQWLTQIAEGLAVAHDSGIIHRDLKAENILINKRGQAKITDLGIAKSQDFNATLTDHIAGSYCSMSPEQAMGETLDFKSDLFSLGILAYQLLCGAHPFGDTGNKLQIMQRIIAHPPTPPHQHNPDLPAGFVALLGQLLSKDPHKRPDNSHWVAAQFAQLSQLLNSTPVSDDTQLLNPQLSANPANQTFSNTHSAQYKHTQDHPTFETRFIASAAAIQLSPRQRFKHWLVQNKISAGLGLLTLVILAGVGIWQLQPRAPKYVAVIPPKLTAEGMQKSQQEIIGEVTLDSLQQGVIALKQLHLIPQNEIDLTEANLSSIQKATAADELITTDIKCKVESCTIKIARLERNSTDQSSRLAVIKTQTVEVLSGDYLIIAEIIQQELGKLYTQIIEDKPWAFTTNEYLKYLTLNRHYRNDGETPELLNQLEELNTETRSLPIVKSLYNTIALDLYHTSNDTNYLSKAEKFLAQKPSNKLDLITLINIFNLKIAQNDLDAAEQTLEKIIQRNPHNASIDQLNGDLMKARRNYSAAIEFYQKALTLKSSSTLLYQTGITYWYAGDIAQAKRHNDYALALSPNFYQALSFKGTMQLLAGDVDAAIESLEKIHSRSLNDPFTLSNLGLAYLLNQDYEKALSIFDQASLAAPKNPLFLLNKADTLDLSGNPRAAIDIYQQVITLETTATDKGNISTLTNLAQAYAHLGQFPNAMSVLKQLEQLAPQDVETFYTAALIYTKSENIGVAIFNVESALNSGMNSLWFNLPWFNKLCAEPAFVKLMEAYASPSRCPTSHNKN